MKLFKYIIRRFYYFKSFLKFKSVGTNVILSSGGYIIRPEEITFGNNVFIARRFYISARDLKFGNNIMIGPNVVIECDNHSYSIPGKTLFEVSNKRKIDPITIENDIWIGANVTILPGTVIREGTVIGAGSVVTKSMPPYTICIGIPCHPIKTRFSYANLKIHLQSISSNYSFEEIINFWQDYKLNDI